MHPGERPTARLLAAVVVLCSALGCTAQEPALQPPTDVPASPAAAPPPASTASRERVPELPAGALRELVPSPQEVPAGLVPLLQSSGPRDAAAVAGFSADAAAAQAALAAHGFTDAYVVQYGAPGDPRTLTAVVVRFTDPDGAAADLEADLAESAGDVLDAEPVGEASQVRRVPLPGDDALDLVTVRFRAGRLTWLLAWRAPAPADPAAPLALARSLAARA